MYPDFSYIFHDLLGTDVDNGLSFIKTFGFFLALGILTASYILGLELKRRERNGSLKPITVMKDGKEITIMPSDKVGDITIVAAISGIIGAKLFAIFESVDSIKSFVKDPFHTLFSGSGLAIYGGLIVAFIVVIRYIKKLGIKPFDMMDATAPALIIGYGVGRIGCQLSGDGDWGIVAKQPKPNWFVLPDWLYAQTYPRNVNNEGIAIPDCIGHYCHELAQGVYPTPLYETFFALIIFAMLWSLRKKWVIPGQIFFLYCIFNGLERFFIEKIRVNERFNVGSFSFTQAELIAVLVFLIGVIGLIWVTQKAKNVTTA